MHVDGQMILPSYFSLIFQLPFIYPFRFLRREKPPKNCKTWRCPDTGVQVLTELQMCLYINFSNSNPRSSSASWHGNFRPALAPTGSKSASATSFATDLRDPRFFSNIPGYPVYLPLVGWMWFVKLFYLLDLDFVLPSPAIEVFKCWYYVCVWMFPLIHDLTPSIRNPGESKAKATMLITKKLHSLTV